MAQSGMVARALEEANPGLTVELVEIRTSGDRIQDVPLRPELGQAFFTKEIEDALLDGRVDLAVHSCKDLSTTMPAGLALGAIPPREDPHDALVTAGATLAELPAGARVGTSSPRRQNFLRHARPDLVIEEQRGNVPTRLAAVGEKDAVILAVSGLKRLGLQDRIVEIIDPSVLLPAAAQGALALQVRADDYATAQVVAKLDDAASRAEVTAERACLHALEAGCQAPVGALARVDGDALVLDAAIATHERVVRTKQSGTVADPEAVGAAAAAALLAELGLDTLRGADWAGPPPRKG
jgi:hydroxymethylbilane synthase